VGERLKVQCHVILYQKDDLYIEAYSNLETEFIRKFYALRKMELLDVYIDKIVLDDVL
jgi:hypothetical protein